jgi:hypothetical protein
MFPFASNLALPVISYRAMPEIGIFSGLAATMSPILANIESAAARPFSSSRSFT